MASYVYEITNKVTGEIYVGKADSFRERWAKHVSLASVPLYAAMREHGIDAFDFKVVETHPAPSFAFRAEAQRMRSHRENGRTLYNDMLCDLGHPAKKPRNARTKSRCDQSCAGRAFHWGTA